jgi:hypothetical protein
MLPRHFFHLLLHSFALLVCSSPQATAQSGIQLAKLNYFEIRTTDPERSKNFYQSLFGLPVQTGSDGRIVLQIGNEQQYMAIRAVADGESPGISQLGYSVSNYDPGSWRHPPQKTARRHRKVLPTIKAGQSISWFLSWTRVTSSPQKLNKQFLIIPGQRGFVATPKTL